MMKKYNYLLFIFFLSICFPNNSIAQRERELDSLLSELKTLPPSIKKVSTYINVFNIYIHKKNQLEQSQKYADTIKMLSEKLNYDFGIANSHYSYARIELFKGDFQSAISHLHTYVQYHEQKKDSIRLTSGLFQLGKAYKRKSDFDKSLSHLYRSAIISEKIDDKQGLASAYNVIANINRDLKKYNKALDYYNKAKAMFIALNNTKMHAMNLQNIGNVYGSQKDYHKAIEHYKKALDLIYSLDAKLNFEKAIILGNLGGSYNGLKDFKKALDYHQRANTIRRTFRNKRTLAYGLAGESTSLIHLERFKEAEKCLSEGIELASKMNSKTILLQLYELKASLSKSQGHYKEALDFTELSNVYKDSIFNETSNQRITELETKYKTTQKDQEIALLTKENLLKEKESQRQDDIKRVMLIGLFLTLLFAGLLFYTQRQKLKNQEIVAAKNEEIKVSKLKEELGTLEMKALRAQMNPHFLFNCMNSINTMILRDDNANASKYLTKFSKLVRLMLENSESPKVTLRDELEMLNAYISLESIRFKGTIDYTLEVSNIIDKDTTLIPSMVIQPFVENAIWHGLLHTTKQRGKLSITLTEDNDLLHFSIRDNGVGREAAIKLNKKNAFKNKSMGIKITTDRLTLLAKQKIKDLVKIIDLKDNQNNALGTQVDILIPMS